MNLDLRTNIVICKGIIKTGEIDDFEIENKKILIRYKGTDKVYHYNKSDVVLLSDWIDINIHGVQVFDKDKQYKQVSGISKLRLFTHCEKKYYVYECFDGEIGQVYDEDVYMSGQFNDSMSILEYFTKCAEIIKDNTSNKVKNPSELTIDNAQEKGNPAEIIYNAFSKLLRVDKNSAADVYLNTKKISSLSKSKDLIFPFGCNSSQMKSVEKALTNQISVIQGPPGTGKTQTILSIIINLIIQGKTVLVVSNNNSAIDNVLEKMEKYGLGFMVAKLGNSENKKLFFDNQPEINEEISNWKKDTDEVV